jgi:hypothetical protein
MSPRPALSGPGGRMNRRGIGAAFAMLLVLASCRWPQKAEAPRPLSQRISWCGRTPVLALDSVPSDTTRAEACIRVLRLEFPGSEAPFRVEVRAYRKPYHAFHAWQSLSITRRNAEGCFKLGARWVFLHGPYVGLTDSSAAELYPEEFKARLAIADEPAFRLPPEFEAFPLRGRIPGSEGLFFRDFLGESWQGPIFTAAYACHGDTALAFRGFPQNPDSLAGFLSRWKGRTEFGKEKRNGGFIGEDEFGHPLILRIFPEGILGFSGCYDSVLTREYAEKMQKMRFFWHDP